MSLSLMLAVGNDAARHKREGRTQHPSSKNVRWPMNPKHDP
jgi:hypothetical protein